MYASYKIKKDLTSLSIAIKVNIIFDTDGTTKNKANTRISKSIMTAATNQSRKFLL